MMISALKMTAESTALCGVCRPMMLSFASTGYVGMNIAGMIAKYFAIIPAAFATTYPQLGLLDVMHLTSPNSAILSAVIFNALIIIALVPLALRGVKYRPLDAASLLRRNLLIYGVGGIIAPFPGIWLIDQLLVMLHLA